MRLRWRIERNQREREWREIQEVCRLIAAGRGWRARGMELKAVCVYIPGRLRREIDQRG